MTSARPTSFFYHERARVAVRPPAQSRWKAGQRAFAIPGTVTRAMTETEAQTAAPASPQAFKVERRTIEFIPENERYGRPRSLFFIWFASNMQITTVVTGRSA
jgi:hypothetical protein